MSSYGQFAYIYDKLMEDVDYKRWASYIKTKLAGIELKENSICELGCGTGNMTMTLAELGYDMIGIDLSYDMLMIAREKAAGFGQDIMYLNQDMTQFELYGTVDSIIATCDSLNYVNNEQLRQVFKLVKNYLYPGGLFIFDLNTEYKFKHVYANRSFSQAEEDHAYIWDNNYDDVKKQNEYYISFFVENSPGLYERFDEYHVEYVHDISFIQQICQDLDLTIVSIGDDYSDKKITKKTERMTFVISKGQ